MFLFGKKPKPPFLSAVIVAAGSAARMEGIDKQQVLLSEVPVVVRSIMAFEYCEAVSEIVVVCRREQVADYYRMVQDFDLQKVSSVVAGGAQRQESVFLGIGACNEEAEFFAIHDGARPLVTQEEIYRCVDAAMEHGAAAVGVPVKDTIKVVSAAGMIQSTPDRSQLCAVQTPQIFAASLYRDAMERAMRSGNSYTDDCQLVEQTGHQVHISHGSYGNIKITTPEDMVIARGILAYREGGDVL